MISVLLVGNGNVANHLLKVFQMVKDLSVLQINSRNLTNIPTAAITIIAVSDDAIAKVSSKITNPFVVHTSGSISLSALQNKTRKGVFYMLQTFSKDKLVNFQEVPFCLEATNENDLKTLETLAKLLSEKVYFINSEQRKALHVAAVFANNFANHCYQIAEEICKIHQVPFEILYPLIEETARKIKLLSPKEAQTGPAIRNDQQTIQNHLVLLNLHQQEMYTIMTKSIQDGH